MTDEVTLTEVPALGPLYARGLLAIGRRARRHAGPAELPGVTYAVHDVPVDTARLTAYQELMGLRAADRLPAGFVHTMAFPLHVALMVRPDFPLAPAGMVHVANRVTQRGPLFRDDRLDLRVRAVDLRPHRSGTQLDLVAEVRRAGSPDVAWEGVSTYLARGVHLAPTPTSTPTSAPTSATSESYGVRAPEASDVPEGEGGRARDGDQGGRGDWVPPVPTASWRLAADTGRRYAAVSGDRNPVHLSRLTARMFGFKRPIAHGMYTAGRALADVGPAAGHAFVWTAEFTKPLLLPATVAVRVAPEDDGFGYAVWRPGAARPYLTGGVHPHA
jgi:hypothetical protein